MSSGCFKELPGAVQERSTLEPKVIELVVSAQYHPHNRPGRDPRRPWYHNKQCLDLQAINLQRACQARFKPRSRMSLFPVFL